MEIAAPTVEELAFVWDSWANSYRKSPYAGCVPNSLYDQVSRECIRGLMNRGALVLCAVTPVEGVDGVRRVMGYSVSEPDRRVLHWLYVKKDFRGMGIGRGLLAATVPAGAEWRYTHRTRSSQKFLGPRFEWADFLARIKD